MLGEYNLMYDIHKCFNVLDNFMYARSSSKGLASLVKHLGYPLHLPL